MDEPISGRYALVVRFQLREGHEDAFDALTAEMLQAIRSSEPGTLGYVVHRAVDSPNIRVFYELYEDVAAFEAHETTPHLRRFLTERAGHLQADPEVWRIEPVAGVMRHSAHPRGG